MSVQRTHTKQLHAPLTTTLGHPKSTQCNFNSCSFNYKSVYSTRHAWKGVKCGISFQGNFALERKFLAIWGKVKNLPRYFGIFLWLFHTYFWTQISNFARKSETQVGDPLEWIIVKKMCATCYFNSGRIPCSLQMDSCGTFHKCQPLAGIINVHCHNLSWTSIYEKEKK